VSFAGQALASRAKSMQHTIVAIPLAIAFGIASGVSPEKGLFTAIVAGFLVSALGGSRVQIGGPTGAFVIIVYGIVQKYGVDGLVVATSGGWSYTHAQFANFGAWVAGQNYTIEAWSVDNAGNQESPRVTRNFQFVNVDPTVGIVMPNPGATSAYNNLSQISGTAADSYCAVTKIELNIQDVTSGTTYYNGTSWVNNPSGALWFNSGLSGTNWAYNIAYPTSVWTAAHAYIVQARAWNAGNRSRRSTLRTRRCWPSRWRSSKRRFVSPKIRRPQSRLSAASSREKMPRTFCAML